MIINLILDNPNSWIWEHIFRITDHLKHIFPSHNFYVLHTSFDIKENSDISIYLGCVKKIPKKIISKSRNNLVIHESSLPQGRGMSPITWQIVEGKNMIPIVIFEMEDNIDEGDIYLIDYINLEGYELIEDIRIKQIAKTTSLIENYLKKYPEIKSFKQRGNPTYYRKRTATDSELDINKSIIEQFNLLRVVDNKRYPAFFKYKNKKYILHIDYEK